MTHEKTLNNRAALLPEKPQETMCTACDEPLVFALEDKHHKFSIGLRTVLECVYFAEQGGYLPSLPDNWWIQIENVYQLSLYPKEGIKNEGVQIEDHRLGTQVD